MELIPLVIVGLVILVLLVKASSNQATPSPTEQPIPGTMEVAPDIGSEPARFDATSAQQVKELKVLEGAAYVTDGDTITIKQTQIRLFGIDAPELNHPYGMRAKYALQRLCKGQMIRAEVTEIDHHGRTVAHCYLPDGRDLSAEMVKLGLAIDWPKFSGGKFKSLETEDVRKRLFLADARQKGRMHVWEKFEERQRKS